MDIQLKPRPWYIRYLFHILAGTVFVICSGYAIFLSIGPRQLKVDAEAHRIVEAVEAPFREYVDVEGLVQPIQTVRLNALESGFV